MFGAHTEKPQLDVQLTISVGPPNVRLVESPTQKGSGEMSEKKMKRILRSKLRTWGWMYR